MSVSRETITPPATDDEGTPPATDDEGTPPATDDEGGDDDELQQTFDRDYVERLRTKSANYRLSAKESKKQVEALRRQLHAEKVKRLDMVVDASEVPYDESHLEDDAALESAIESLLETKPYLKKRKTSGDIGQHTNRSNRGGFSLMDELRRNAG